MEIEKLKQKILDLAIRGKLVPQDPNDEPASVLIDRIRAEKEELIKQGKIKRSKEDSYIYKGSDNCYYEKVGNKTTCINEEIPFEIPDNWTWCRVGIISNYGSNTIVNDVDIKEDAWVLELEDIEGYTSTLLTHRIKGNRKFGSSKYKFNAGDLLFSKLRVYLKKVIIADMPGFCSSEILALNFMPYCLNEYAAIFFISSYLLNKVAQIEYGCKMPRLGTNDGKKLLFPLPPMQEQIRIVKQYKTLNFHIDKLRHSKQLLDKYIDEIKIKILDDIFGENSRYKSYYENSYLLGDILEYEQPAKYTVESTEYSDDYETPVLTPGKTFILGYTNEKDGIYRVNDGSVIIFDDFTTASRIVDFDFKVKSSAMKILTVSDIKMFNIEYLYYLLQTIKVNNNTHKRYWISEFATKELFVHTIEQQKEIINSIKSTFALLDKMSSSI